MVLMDPAKVEALMVTVPRPKGLGSTSAEILPQLQGLCDIFNVANVGRAKSPTEVVATVSEMKSARQDSSLSEGKLPYAKGYMQPTI